MKQEKPINLNLLKFHFPVMAIVSLLHRISGVLIFLFIPALLYALHDSLISQNTFSQLQRFLNHPLSKIAVIVVLAAAIYHLFAGIRHLIMDCGLWESKIAGRVTAWLTILLAIITVVLLGVCLW